MRYDDVINDFDARRAGKGLKMSTIYLTYNIKYKRLFCEGLNTAYEFFEVVDLDVLDLYDLVWDYVERYISLLSSNIEYFCDCCDECEECDEYVKLVHADEMNIYSTFDSTFEVLRFECRLS